MPPLSLTLNPKFLGHSGLPETLAFPCWAKVSTCGMAHQWAPCNRNIQRIWSILHCPFALRGASVQSLHPSRFMVAGARLEESSLRLWHLQNPRAFQQSAEMSELPPIPLPLYRQHSLGARLAAFIFSPDCVSPGRCAVQAVQTLLLLVAAPRPQAPGCTDRRLSPTCGPCLVPLIRLLSWSGANGPRSGHLSFRASCWLRYPLMCEDIWGSAADF